MGDGDDLDNDLALQDRVGPAPNARLETLAGQTHMVKPKVVAAAVAPFLAAPTA